MMNPNYYFDVEKDIAIWTASEENQRNGEGDAIQLADGRILFAYSRFQSGNDDSAADIRGVYSRDGGKTWEDEHIIQPNIGRHNIMCVSLLSLADGRTALVFNVKNGQRPGDFDCRPYIIYSEDDCANWSEPQPVCQDRGRYYVNENSRLVQLSSGRIIVPLALLVATDPFWFAGCCAYSDDNGETWSMSEFVTPMDRRRTGIVETGIVELDPTRRSLTPAEGGQPVVMMYGRSRFGEILHSISVNGGVTWKEPEPLGPQAPVAPSLIRRIPSTGDLLLLYNAQDRRTALPEWRSPLTAAISKDEGQTWINIRDIEPDISSIYDYPSVTFTRENTAVISYYRTLRMGKDNGNLNEMRIRVLDVEWFYR